MSGEAERAAEPGTGTAAQRDWPQIALEEVLRPLVIAAMIGCLALSLAQLVGLAEPAWGGAVGPVLAFVVALEAIHSQRFSSRRLHASRDRARFHLVEAVVLLIGVRLALYLLPSAPRLADDLALWASNLGALLTLPYILLAVVLASFWAGAYILSRAFQDLEASVFEQAPAITDPRYDLWITGAGHRRTDRQALLRQISGTFAAGGLVMLVLTGLARVDLSALIRLQHTRNSEVIVYAVVYFLLGFLLISQAQYATLKANWQLERIPVLSPLGRRWLILAVAFLALVGLLAALLPVNYSADVLHAAARWVGDALLRIALGIAFVVTLIATLLSRLFGAGQSGEAPMQATPTPEPEEIVPALPHDPVLWWQVARSVLFWVVLIGIVGYSLYHFVGDRWGVRPRLRIAWLGGWFRRLLAGLRRVGRNAYGQLRAAVAQRIAARRARQPQAGTRYVGLGRLTPRERVRYFYVSIAARGARQGIARPAAATPSEYQALLADSLPEAAEDIERLTQAFQEARYSAHTLTREDERPVRLWWQRVKQALLLRRKPPSGAGQANASVTQAPKSRLDHAHRQAEP